MDEALEGEVFWKIQEYVRRSQTKYEGYIAT